MPLDHDDDATARRTAAGGVLSTIYGPRRWKRHHIPSSCQGICSIQSGIVFMDALTHLERAADQCSSIAMTMLGRNNEAIMSNHHDYLYELHASGDQVEPAERPRGARSIFVPLQRDQNTSPPHCIKSWPADSGGALVTTHKVQGNFSARHTVDKRQRGCYDKAAQLYNAFCRIYIGP